MAKFFKSLALSELYYFQIVNIQKEMDSKMYVLLIIIWLMYLPRGKRFLFKEILLHFL